MGGGVGVVEGPRGVIAWQEGMVRWTMLDWHSEGVCGKTIFAWDLFIEKFGAASGLFIDLDWACADRHEEDDCR